MKPKVYIDGKDGTTGLQIYDRLGKRGDIELLLIDESKRKDTAARQALLNAADIVFLCLPDEAAVEAVSLVENPNTRIIDASTAHRTAPGWDYGFPELSLYHRSHVQRAKRLANPGCHASGFIAMVYPLVAMGILPPDYPLSCFSLTGYSGGGKKMIAQYENTEKAPGLYSPRIYGLNLQHKHLPEMQHVCRLSRPPVFSPIVDDYYQGMATTITLHNDLLLSDRSAQQIWDVLSDYYQSQALLTVAPFADAPPLLAANAKAGTDGMELVVCGHEGQTSITALFDNLGKGASGAAVQNMNLMLGLEETTGLQLSL